MSPGAWRILRAVAALAITIVFFVLIFRRVPFHALGNALRDADYRLFLALMIPNVLFYFAWDTLVLTAVIRWFHAPVPYTQLLPVRAASYVVGYFNTNLGRGAMAAYLSRRLRAPLLELGSTVIFLVLTEYTQLVIWSLLGIVGFRAEITAEILAVAVGVAAFWLLFFLYNRLHVTPSRMLRFVFAPRQWRIFRTLRLATVARLFQIVALRAPMFVVALVAHYYAAGAFGMHIPFGQMLAFLPVIFMIAALPVTVAHLGSTQAAWIFFFSQYAPAPRLLAFSLAAHLVFSSTRAVLGLLFLPKAYFDLVPGAAPAAGPGARASS